MKQLNHAINAIRINGIEAVNKAKSGHPGIVLGAAPTLATLFANHFTFLPDQPDYFNRDRFVLSAGHGSALLYSVLAACQFKGVNIADLASFRQLNSAFAGHPERHELSGIEVTTGPLGQGVANAVGLAIAEARLNKLTKGVIDHYTYCLFGDGCFQEGIFHEVVSVASFYNLKKLILIYDANDVQLDGPTADSESLNPKKYFEALNFDCHWVNDGEDVAAIDQALTKAKQSDRPSVIIVKSIIGIYSPKANSNTVHGAPLSTEEIAVVRNELNYSAPAFSYDQEVYQAFDGLKIRGLASYQDYQKRFEQFVQQNPEQANWLRQLENNKFDLSFLNELDKFNKTNEATRNLVGQVYQLVTECNPTITTLNCDLSVSTKIIHSGKPKADANNHEAPNWNLGVRELGMMGINNGITAHGGILGVGSTFLAFADYTKPALRVGAISSLPTLTVFSHDSIMVGEDGPTHQPIEQLAMLRATPNVYVARPCNVSEIAAAFELWLTNEQRHPVVITSSRHNFTIHESSLTQARKGGYIIYGSQEYASDITILATGSEVALAVDVAKLLEQKNITVRVVSLWCWELFQQQPHDYVDKILGTGTKVSLELGCTMGWNNFADYCLGIDHFGASAKGEDLLKAWKITPADVAEDIEVILKNEADL